LAATALEHLGRYNAFKPAHYELLSDNAFKPAHYELLSDNAFKPAHYQLLSDNAFVPAHYELLSDIGAEVERHGRRQLGRKASRALTKAWKTHRLSQASGTLGRGWNGQTPRSRLTSRLCLRRSLL
jgi:hypothetical protein